MTNWEEIEQGTRKGIVLQLLNEEPLRTSDFSRELDVSKSTVNKQINNLNDMSVVHKGKNGYELISDNVRTEKATNKYVPEFLVFVPSAILFASFAFAYNMYRMDVLGLLLGFLSAFSFPFMKKVYDVVTEKEYTRVLRKKEKDMESIVS